MRLAPGGTVTFADHAAPIYQGRLVRFDAGDGTWLVRWRPNLGRKAEETYTWEEPETLAVVEKPHRGPPWVAMLARGRV